MTSSFWIRSTSLLSLCLAASSASAWGGRGHHLICEVATRLVDEPELASFLAGRPHLMGHVCNIPDIYWKSTDEMRKSGDDTHFIDPELIGKTPRTFPLDFQEAAGAINPTTGAPAGRAVGSAWWRAEQFYRRGIEAASKAASSPAPTREEEQKDALPFNQGVYDMMVSMGLLGHFVGDSSMPLHNTVDYDAKEKGHAGLHAFYEDRCVAELALTINDAVRRRARSFGSKTYKQGTVVERMQRLSGRAYDEIEKMVKSDRLIGTDQATGRVQRPEPKDAYKRFEKMIIRQMADSALQLAMFWDEIYRLGGKPKLSAYRSYRYPFQPDFVAPDYLVATPPPEEHGSGI